MPIDAQTIQATKKVYREIKGMNISRHISTQIFCTCLIYKYSMDDSKYENKVINRFIYGVQYNMHKPEQENNSLKLT